MSSSASWQSMRRASWRLALVAGLLASTGSIAQDYGAQTLGDWVIAPAKDKRSCVLTREYEGKGGTTLLIGLATDATNYLSVINRNWSIRKGDRMPLDFRLSNGRYAKHDVVGLESKGEHGFVTSFEPKFPAYLATSQFLNIDRGDVPVARLALDGSGAAVAELRRCVGLQGKRDAAEAADHTGSTMIPADPFADRKGRRK